ncbi:MAG: hypothetical protein WC211_12130 [Dehalococcoidia bacterium]
MSETSEIVARGTLRNVRERIVDVRALMDRLASTDCKETERSAYVLCDRALAHALSILDRDEVLPPPAQRRWFKSAYWMASGLVKVSSPLLSPGAAMAVQAVAVVFDELARRKWDDRTAHN